MITDRRLLTRYKIVSKTGATFTLMVAGESGLGKTTFINTLFQTTLKTKPDHKARHARGIRLTVEIDIVRAELEEKDFKMRLNIIDTPGFGDNVNNRRAFQPLIDFIDDQHDNYMKQEQQPLRKHAKDLRVHACLYFIRPTGHLLKPLDIEVMKKLSTRVNLVPVIAKADTLLPAEIDVFKQRIRAVIEAQEIKIYSPPIETDDPASAEHLRALIEAIPFAVIGSETKVVNASGDLVLGREYPWGVAEVENEEHLDFLKLRLLLLRTNMLDLILLTEELHYESYRTLKLEGGDKEDQRAKLAKRFNNNPQFKEEEDQLKKFFTDKVKAEEARFRQWELNIINERQRLNLDLESVQHQIKQLEEQIKELNVKKGFK